MLGIELRRTQERVLPCSLQGRGGKKSITITQTTVHCKKCCSHRDMWFSLSAVAKNVVQELTGNSNREEILILSNTSTDSLLLSLDSFLGVTKHCSPQPEATSVLYFYSVPHFAPPWCLLHSPFPPTSHKTFPGSCKSGRNKLTLQQLRGKRPASPCDRNFYFYTEGKLQLFHGRVQQEP